MPVVVQGQALLAPINKTYRFSEITNVQHIGRKNPLY
jgi:hypothetical protein